MGNKDKTRDGDAATSTETNRDRSQDQEARDAALTQTITKAVAREMAKAHAQYQDYYQREKCTPTLPTSLKIIFRITMVLGLWTPSTRQRTRSIYQRWQLMATKG